MKTHITEREIALLQQSNEEQLLETLGLRAAIVTDNLSLSAETSPKIVAETLTAMGIQDDFKDLGRRILRRWERTAFELVCGKDPEDAKSRTELRNALGAGEAAAIGVLTAVLISAGLMAALAPVVAAILVKKFFNSAYDVFCQYWQEKLPVAK